MSFTLFGGVNEPFVDCMPRTNVAESAEVTKNDTINKIAKTDMMNDIGITLNISKIVSSVLGIVKSTSPFFWISIAVVPNAENQNVTKKCRCSKYANHELPNCPSF